MKVCGDSVYTESYGENYVTYTLIGKNNSTGIMLSTLWNQSGIVKTGNNITVKYNEYCPIDPETKKKSITGCTNTAAAQILYFFIEKHDLDLDLMLIEADRYTSSKNADIIIKSDGSTPGTLSFNEINMMLESFSIDSAADIAALNYACGVIQRANYSSSATSTAWSLSLFDRAGFAQGNYVYSSKLWGTSCEDPLTGEEKYVMSDGAFEVIIENLQAGSVVGTSYPGHALVIDGYNPAKDLFHINFGWGTHSSTRWYTREEMREQGYCKFLFDLYLEHEEDIYVNDPDFYGVGTMLRGFEKATSDRAYNVIHFMDNVADKVVTVDSYIALSDSVLVKDMNMQAVLTNDLFGEDHRSQVLFYAADGSCGFENFNGAGIVNTSVLNNTVFGNFSSSSMNVDLSGALVYAGNFAVNQSCPEGVQKILEEMKRSQEELSDLSEEIIADYGNNYAFFGNCMSESFIISDNSYVVGDIYMNDGYDTIRITGNSRLYGDVQFTDKPSDSNFTIDSTSRVVGSWEGGDFFNFILEQKLNDEAIYTLTGDADGMLESNLLFSMDVTSAANGVYSLITVADSEFNSDLFDNISISVFADSETAYSIDVGESCAYGSLYVEDDTLKFKVANRLEADNIAPDAPDGLTATVTGSNVALDWNDAVDNIGVEKYFYRFGQSSDLSGIGNAVYCSEAELKQLDDGDYYFQVRSADAAGNYSNWSESKKFTVRNKLPDLQFSAVTVASNGLVGGGVTFNFTLTNNGAAAAAASTVALYAGETKIGTLDISRLAAGKSYKGKIHVSPKYLTVGDNYLKLVADDGNVLAESNEANNIFEDVVSLKMPDFPDLLVTGSVVTNGNADSTMTVYYTVENIGRNAAEAFEVVLRDTNGELTAVTQTVSGLKAGEKYNGSFSVAGNSLSAGEHWLQVTANPQAELVEITYNNNSFSEKITLTSESTLPDLYFDDIVINNNSASVDLGNSGGDVNTPFTVSIWSGSEKIASETIDSIRSGEQRRCHFKLDNSRFYESKVLRFSIDNENVIAESNESNNVAYFTNKHILTSLPDLVVKSFTVSDAGNGKYAVEYVIANMGDDDVFSVCQTVLNCDGKFIAASELNKHYGDDKTQKGVFYVSKELFTPGQHLLELVADGYDAVTESNENNNSSYSSITIPDADGEQYADLVITSVAVPAAALADEDVLVTLKVANQGKIDAERFDLVLKKGSEVIYSFDIKGLEAGDLAEYSFLLPSEKLGIGEHDLQLTVDANDHVSESNENNNTKSFTVSLRNAVTNVVYPAFDEFTGDGGVWLYDYPESFGALKIRKEQEVSDEIVAPGEYDLGEVYHGGVVRNFLVKDGGSLEIITRLVKWDDQWFIPENGGKVYDTVIENQGTLYVAAMGYAKNITVCAGGSLFMMKSREDKVNFYYWDTDGNFLDEPIEEPVYLEGCGTLENANILYGGKAYIAGGSTLKGDITLGGTVKICDEISAAAADVTFDISDRIATDTMIVDNLNYLSAGTYTVNVDLNQYRGDYVLAGNAANFNRTVTVKNENGTLGSLTVNGNSLKDNSASYSLKIVDSKLIFSVNRENNVEPAEHAPVELFRKNEITYRADAVYDQTLQGDSLKNDLMQVYGGQTYRSIVSSGGKMVMTGREVFNANLNKYEQYLGFAEGTQVLSGGIMQVLEDSIITDTEVRSGGVLELDKNVYLCGTLDAGGRVVVKDSTNALDMNLIFNLTERTIEDTFIIDNLDDLQAATYSITVKPNQAEGVYKLAAGAADFNDIVTLNIDGCKLLFSMIGETLNIEGMNYSLEKDKNLNLNLVISSEYSPNTGCGDSAVELFKDNDIVFTIKNDTVADGYTVSGDSNYDLMHLHNAGKAENTVVGKDGKMVFYNNSYAENTTIKAGGKVVMQYNTVLNGAVVEYGGVLSIVSDAVLSGSIRLSGTLNAYGNIDGKDAELIFDLTDRNVNDYYIIDKNNIVNADYRIAVSDDQAFGSYRLISGCNYYSEGFILDIGQSLSTVITCNGNALHHDGKKYELKTDDNGLSFTVTPDESLICGEAPVEIYDDGKLTKSDSSVFMYTVKNVPPSLIQVIQPWYKPTCEVIHIHNGGYGMGIAVLTGGYVLVTGEFDRQQNSFSGGHLKSSNISNMGTIEVNGGATVEDITIFSGGVLNVSTKKYVMGQDIYSAAGTLTDITVAAGGSLNLAQGSVLSGSVDLGGTITVTGAVDAENADIIFNLMERSANDDIMVNGFRYLKNAKSFSIMYDDSLQEGIYQLTDSVLFEHVALINENGQKLEHLYVTDKPVQIGNFFFDLQNIDGNLQLAVNAADRVSDEYPPNDWMDIKRLGQWGEVDRTSVGVISESTVYVIDGWVGGSDRDDYYEFELENAARLSFNIESDDKLQFAIYSLQSNKNGYSLKKLQATNLLVSRENGGYTVDTKELLLDADKYYIGVHGANASDADYTIWLDDKSVFYPDGDSSDDWTDIAENGWNGEVDKYSIGTVDEYSYYLTDNFVGYTDKVDYMEFYLAHAASLSLDVLSSDAVSVVIGSLQEKNGKWNLKTLSKTAVKADEEKAGKNVLLEAGYYYIGVTSTNAAKGGYADYMISVNDSSKFFNRGDNSDDWTDITVNGAAGMVDHDSLNDLITGVSDRWVGFGDEVDCMEFTIDVGAELVFDVESTDALKFNICRLEGTAGNYKLKNLQSTTVKAGQSISTKSLLLDNETYYIQVISTNAAKGGDAEYRFAVNQEKSTFFDDPNSNNSDNDLEHATYLGTINDAGKTVSADNWVGKGDEADFFSFDAACDMDVVFAVSSSDKVTFTIYDYSGSKLSQIRVNANADKSTKKLSVTAGRYYCSVTSDNASQGGDAAYSFIGGAFAEPLQMTIDGVGHDEFDRIFETIISGSCACGGDFAEHYKKCVSRAAAYGDISGTTGDDKITFIGNKNRFTGNISTGWGNDRVIFEDSTGAGGNCDTSGFFSKNYFESPYKVLGKIENEMPWTLSYYVVESETYEEAAYSLGNGAEPPLSSYAEESNENSNSCIIALGRGNDLLDLGNYNNLDSFTAIMLDEGDDQLKMGMNSNIFMDKTLIYGGDGEDLISLAQNAAISGTGRIVMGSGDDTVKLESGSRISLTAAEAGDVFDFGSGDDELSIAKGSIVELDGVGLDMGYGNDSLILNGSLLLRGTATLKGIEKISGRGSLLLDCEVDEALSAELAKFRTSNIDIVNTQGSDRFTDKDTELRDNSFRRAKLLKKNDEADVWLCSEEKADAVEYGFADEVDYFRFYKNSSTTSLNWDIEGEVQLTLLNSRCEVMADADLDLGEFSLDQLKNGTYYIRLSAETNSAAAGWIKIDC